ncbi:MAG: hypothetical protein E7557_03795 [Ruminococcaceae bacterium]|nr:hypothetical protein [Oscillospiraceae bacterium]
MLLRKTLYLRIEYHWYCVSLLKKQLSNSNENKKQKLIGKMCYHKYKANALSYQYEILVGLRNEKGEFSVSYTSL